MARVLMVVAPERFRDEELFATLAVLEGGGHEVNVASTRVGDCVGSRGGHGRVGLTLGDQRAANYDAVVFVGGVARSCCGRTWTLCAWLERRTRAPRCSARSAWPR
jgi:protease I